ncbi:unnamed protein product [Callosobruchus maculatus]|uniref:Uncharacterized protein n=1 Tax=Callosobruchus maculatus TaxID=64391 RepID=A0A653CJ08_CALMS|nr:unnamed protein product [Callosobruchus maculatus]
MREMSTRPLNIQGLFFAFFPFPSSSFTLESNFCFSSVITLHGCYIAIAFTCLVAT